MTTTDLNRKISEIENKIPDTSSLEATTVLNTKISEVKDKISGHAKYITTPEFDKLTAESFVERLKQANLLSKTDFHIKLKSFNRTVITNKTKYLENKKKTK